MKSKYLKKIMIFLFCVIIIISGFCYIKKQFIVRNAIELYRDFLSTKDIENSELYQVVTPTGEPERKYFVEYAMIDSDGDRIPELHIRSPREYLIYTISQGEISYMQGFFSRPWHYYVLNDGSMVYWDDGGMGVGEYYHFFALDSEGNRKKEWSLYWEDANNNGVQDIDDSFYYNNKACGLDDWLKVASKYIDQEQNNNSRILNQVKWQVLQEKK